MRESTERQLRRQLLGIPPQEAERRLREQADRFALELRHLREAIEQAKAEEAQLTAQCEALAEEVQAAAGKLARLRKGLERSRAMAPIHALVLAREIADLEDEHAAKMAELAAEQERIRAEIAERRSYIQRWVNSLLESVAARGAG